MVRIEVFAQVVELVVGLEQVCGQLGLERVLELPFGADHGLEHVWHVEQVWHAEHAEHVGHDGLVDVLQVLEELNVSGVWDDLHVELHDGLHDELHGVPDDVHHGDHVHDRDLVHRQDMSLQGWSLTRRSLSWFQC